MDGRRALYDALRALENDARQALTNPTRRDGDKRPPRYSRRAAVTAVEKRLGPGATVSKTMIKDWAGAEGPGARFEDSKVPSDFAVLWALVQVWLDWAGTPEQHKTREEGYWNGRWSAARHHPSSPARADAPVRAAHTELGVVVKSVFADRERVLNARTPRVLPGGGYAVDRSAEVGELAVAMREAGESTGMLVVSGEPSVGKSVLVLQAVDRLRTEGAAVAVSSLREPLDSGYPLPQLFEAFTPAVCRLLVLDGAEVVQEGCSSRLSSIADAAHRAGLGVVVVVRDDAKDTVAAVLTDLAGASLRETAVAPLPSTAVEALIAEFPGLARLKDRRSRWLLGRVGLVDLVLRAGRIAPLRDGTLSDADLFKAAWEGWVRRHGEHAPAGPSPDARERALLEVARARLGLPCAGDGPDAVALPSLRSDGLLQRYNALRPGEDFPNDLVRDFAIVHLLLRDGHTVIETAGGPRWTLRAARVACQARLVFASGGDGRDGLEELQQQLEVFDALGATHGSRWADVPWEAVLRCGLAKEVLDAASVLLIAAEGARLGELLRVAEQYFSDIEAVDPVFVEPVVAWLVDRGLVVPRQVAKRALDVLVFWLRGVRHDPTAGDDATTRDIRRRVRAAVLARDPQGHDEHTLEALALLGDDLDDTARTVLRTVAARHPQTLHCVVERYDAVHELATRDSQLLVELAAAYYIEVEEVGRYRPSRTVRDGVRPHRVGGRGAARSAWYYGPYWALLQADLRPGLRLISTLLAHAARVRVGPRPGQATGVTVDLLGLGERIYLGDAQVFGWYRGGLGSPGPCTSALLACERMMDQVTAQRVPLRAVARSVLIGAHDLAMVGLVVGFLVRHLDQVTDELDDFLACPELWRLESVRAGTEQVGPHVRDDTEVRGRHLRGLTFRDVAVRLAARAVVEDDHEAGTRLGGVAERLLAAATVEGVPPAEVRLWASHLDPDRYTPIEVNGQPGLAYDEPTEITTELAGHREDLDRTSEVCRLFNRYHLTMEPPFAAGLPLLGPEEVRRDLPIARDLAERSPSCSGWMLDSAVTGVAAAVLRIIADGDASGAAGREGLAWATRQVLETLATQSGGMSDADSSFNGMGAAGSAAAALPLLLTPAFTDGQAPLLNIDTLDVVAEALSTATTCPADEIRRITALHLRRLWAAPCGPAGAPCRHQVAWAAVEAGARDVAIGPLDAQGHRPFTTLAGDLNDALRQTLAEYLVLPWLAAALASACYAASATCCIAADAGRLRESLLEAYARTAVHDGDQGFSTMHDEDHALMADALLATAERDVTVLTRAVTAMRGRSQATSDLLDATCIIATYDKTRRAQLRALWPAVMRTALDLPEPTIHHVHRAHTMASLIPTPQTAAYDLNISSSLTKARENWLTAAELAPLVKDWLPIAAGHPKAIAQLTALLLGSPLDEQVHLGLPWIRRLVTPNGRRSGIDNLMLKDWLTALHDTAVLKDRARRDYDAIIDTLAAEGLGWAREIQQRDT